MSDPLSPPALPRLARMLLLGVILGTCPLRGEIEARTSPPPQAVPISVKVDRGGTVEIPLRIFGATGEEIAFKIRKQPARGTLSDQRVVQRDLSAITYSHSGEAGPTSDSFAYSAQSTNGVSAPAIVNIRILDAPSLLLVPEKVEFDPAVVGHPAVQFLKITNRGGGVTRGVVTVEAPWSIDGDAVYALGPNAEASFPLVFDPQAVRTYRGTVRYSSDPLRSTQVSGKGDAPFSVEPATIELQPSQKSRERSAVLTIHNRLDTPQELHLEIPDPITGPTALRLPPGGKGDVTLSIPAENMDATSGGIAVRGEGYSATVPAQAAAVPARLEIQPAEIRLEPSEASPSPSARLTALNSGGQRTFVRATVKPPFVIAPGDREFTLEPNGTYELTVSLPSEAAGRFRAPLVLSGFQTRAEATLSGEVNPSGAASGPAPRRPRPLTPSSVAVERPAGARFAATPPPNLENVAPPGSRGYIAPPDPHVVKVTRNSATLEWDRPAEGDFSYVLEERIMSLTPGGEIQTEWRPVEEKPDIGPAGHVTIGFADLRAAHPYTLRIAAVKSDGSRSSPSPPFTFVTQARPSFRPSIRSIFLVALVILVGIIVRQRFFSGGTP